MVSVASNAFALEQVRETQARRNLVLGDEVVSILWLIDDEFADLSSISTALVVY